MNQLDEIQEIINFIRSLKAKQQIWANLVQNKNKITE